MLRRGRWRGWWRCRSTRSNPSLDHLVRDLLEVQRDIETERLRGLEVDEKLELGRLLHRQFAGLGALQNLVGIHRGSAAHLDLIGGVGNQRAVFKSLARVRKH